MTNYILIDGSYFVFFRYHAILNWFRLSHSNDDISKADQHPDFIAKFKKTFITSFQEISKKLLRIFSKKKNLLFEAKKHKNLEKILLKPNFSEIFLIALICSFFLIVRSFTTN